MTTPNISCYTAIMSVSKEMTITCPNCGKKTKTLVYNAVDASQNPELKASVLDGTIFMFQCPGCNDVARLHQDFVYSDPNRKLMIAYACTEQSISDMESEISRTKEQYSAMGIAVSYRITRDAQSLSEKVLITEDGFDDRVVEVIKAAYAQEAREQNPDTPFNRVQYISQATKGAGYDLVFTNGDEPVFSAQFTKADYDRFAAFGKEQFPKTKHAHPYIVDEEWARECFTE